MAQSGPVERRSDRWASIVLSVLLHGVLVVAVGYAWWSYKRERPAPTLAIDATVVDAKSVPGLGNQPPQPQPPPAPPPQPQPQPPPETQPQVEPEGPPQPTPEELAKRDQEQKEAQERADQAAKAKQQEEDQKRLEQERQQEAALAEEKAAEQKRVEEKRLAEERQQKQAQEKAEAERKAQAAAEAKKKQAEQQEAAQREAELRASLDQELRQDQARSSGALASWQSQITARIQRAWLKPPSARTGIECVLNVTQVPGGEVTNVRIGTCNGDQAVRESIEAAVYRASPLPPPPDPSLFERNLVITFRPD